MVVIYVYTIPVSADTTVINISFFLFYDDFEIDFFAALQDGIRRRHLETLEKAIELGKESRFSDKLATMIKDAEEVRDHLRKLDRFAHDILEMKQTTISELRSYKKPPEVVEDVMKATLVLLGEKRINVQVSVACI